MSEQANCWNRKDIFYQPQISLTYKTFYWPFPYFCTNLLLTFYLLQIYSDPGVYQTQINNLNEIIISVLIEIINMLWGRSWNPWAWENLLSLEHGKLLPFMWCARQLRSRHLGLCMVGWTWLASLGCTVCCSACSVFFPWAGVLSQLRGKEECRVDKKRRRRLY